MREGQAAVVTPVVTDYQRRHLQAVRDLLFRSSAVHTHLDWFETDQWLETGDAVIRLCWQRQALVGVLAASGPWNGASWLRVAGLAAVSNQRTVLGLLWDDLSAELRRTGVTQVVMLVMNNWIAEFVAELGFEQTEEIVTLVFSGHELPTRQAASVVVRSAEPRDLDGLMNVDLAAFAPPWQMTPTELRQAFRMCASCTVALQESAIVGYQMSTLYFDGAHLARLAVVPQTQGNGVGAMLLGDVLDRCFRRGVYTMSVNTQASNTRSRRLYSRFGFKRNGYDFPCWSVTL